MRRFAIVIVLLVLFVVSLACGSSATPLPAVISSPTPAPVAGQSTSAPVATETPAAAPMAKLGETLELSGISLSATQVIDPGAPSVLYQAEAGKRLIAVEVIVGNVSSADKVSVNPLNFTLVDAEGFTYKLDLGGADGQLNAIDIAIGEKVKGLVGFKIPDAAIPASIKFQPVMFSNTVLQVGLTP